ncbi:serpin family A member 4 [Phyllostomus discolor]|uniref:Kallistatin-like n=1 Tax=Phyllostomus discolor TaxID=89673 RepID=A0A6J2LA29_9CHIR|nr:kallistatin-like [Phyllostomus discolor]KAF6132822.1 serpin family A member 4 [Phyllostomus discolor]
MPLADHLLLLLVGLLALSHDGRSQTAEHQQEDPGTDEGSPMLRIAPSNTDFALSFYHLVASQNPKGNVFFSPLSISAAYAMLSLGARADTWAQILEGLGFNLTEVPESDIHRGFRHLLRTLNLPNDRLETRVGSALFLGQDLQPLPSFLNDTTAFYGAKVFQADFLDAEGTAQLINNHVREETRGKIENVVSRITPEVVMVLVNYIYFKGLWEKPFSQSKSYTQDFHVDEKTVVQVPMMFQDRNYHWYLHDRYLPCSVLRMDYHGHARALFILPDKGKMKQVEEVLTPEMLSRWNSLLQRRSFYKKLELHLPKFSISGSYDLDEILPQLGIRDLFSRAANLSGITTQQNMLVSKSFHKAVLEVDEAGTQAAAATRVSVIFLSAARNPYVLRFNRPFFVVIFSTSTQSILFLGKVVNPTES